MELFLGMLSCLFLPDNSYDNVQTCITLDEFLEILKQTLHNFFNCLPNYYIHFNMYILYTPDRGNISSSFLVDREKMCSHYFSN